jgi:hypothetical protein
MAASPVAANLPGAAGNQSAARWSKLRRFGRGTSARLRQSPDTASRGVCPLWIKYV